MNNFSAYPESQNSIRPTLQSSTPAARWFQSLIGIRFFVLIAFTLFFAGANTVHAQTTTGTPVTGVSNGNMLFNTTFNCHNCHTASSANRYNTNKVGGHITFAHGQGMGGTSTGTVQQYAEIAAYLAPLFTDLAAQSLTFGVAKAIAIPNIAFITSYGNYAGLRSVASPARGGVTYHAGYRDKQARGQRIVGGV